MAEEAPVERFGRDDSVRECLEVLTSVLEEQKARGRHYDTKTGTIAGFSATSLALNVALGAPLLDEDLGCVGDFLVSVFFVLAAVALAGAGVAAVLGVMRPMPYKDLTAEQIDEYSDRPKVVTDPEDLRMTWLRTVGVMALSARAAGEEKGVWSARAVWLLVIGVVAIAGQAATLALAQ